MSRRPAPNSRAATDAAPPRLALHYRRRSGRRRSVLVAVDETDVWFVYDVAACDSGVKTGLLVDRLGGYDDKLDQALALAADYHAAQVAFHAGAREEFTCPDPLPGPPRRPLAVIRKDAARVRSLLAARDTKPTAAIAA